VKEQTVATKSRKKFDENITKGEKCAQLLETRTEKLLGIIKLLGKLKTSPRYDFDETAANEWFVKIEEGVTELAEIWGFSPDVPAGEEDPTSTEVEVETEAPLQIAVDVLYEDVEESDEGVEDQEDVENVEDDDEDSSEG